MAKRNVGSTFDDFLKEEGLFEEVTAVAIKRFIAYQLAKKMSEDNLSKAEMARRMETSRSALDRLLDPHNPSVTLQTLQSAAHALGGRLKVELDFHARHVRKHSLRRNPVSTRGAGSAQCTVICRDLKATSFCRTHS